MKLRVLFVGFDNDETPIGMPSTETFRNIPISTHIIPNGGHFENIDGKQKLIEYRYKYNEKIPTIYDYRIVFIRNPYEIYNMKDKSTTENMRNDLINKKEEIRTFVEKGGILCTSLMYEEKNNYEWLPFMFDIISKRGEEIEPEITPFQKIFKKYSFEWLAHFKYTESSDIILAKNLFDFPVSLVRKKGKGMMIFLPIYGGQADVSKNLLRDMIDIVKKNILIKPGIKSIQPNWLEKYNLPDEKSLLKEIEDAKKQIFEFNIIKQILYETGEPLVDSLKFLFNKLGFQVTIKEMERIQDIELRHEKFFGIIEVKGKNKDANIKDIRQLLDWYIDVQGEDESKTVKPIFIMNHFREDEPKVRGEPFTQKALETGKKNDFCLVTTYYLFNMYQNFLKGIITIDDIKKILNKNGFVG